jgi:hypothetical protein
MLNAMGDFKKLIELNRSTGLFVDKTLFIREMIRNEDPVLITRPRRWGKTLNINMLFYYFVHRDQLKGMGREDTFIAACEVLFEGLKIWNPKSSPDLDITRSHFRQHPVIFISFAVSGDDASTDKSTEPDWLKIKSFITGRIARLFSEMNYVAQDLETQLQEEERKHLEEERKYLEEERKQFDLELTKHVQRYREQFGVQEIPPSVQESLYHAVTAHFQQSPKQPTSCISPIKREQLQAHLRMFHRLSNGEPKDSTELSNSINFLAHLLS